MVDGKLVQAFLEFVQDMKNDSLFKKSQKWIVGEYADVYLRKSRRWIDDELVWCIDIASITVNEECRGQGVFRSFLDVVELETSYKVYVYVECILETRLIPFLKGRGYQDVSGVTTPPSYARRGMGVVQNSHTSIKSPSVPGRSGSLP